ncbi:glycosyltransferase family 4 protein [Micromonospora radicis]|nr:glycosyltransferase family 4 protein [Micromonospora radicis]
MTHRFFEPGFRAGGPVRAIARLLDSCSEQVTVTLVTGDHDLGVPQPYPGLSGRWLDRGRSRIFYLSTRSPRQWWGLWRTLRREPFDLLYVNSLWCPFSITAILATRLRLIRAARVTIAPRGEFSPAALALKATKKEIFLRLWGPFLRRGDVRWHATCQLEADLIRRRLPWATALVCADEVDLPAEPIPPVRLADRLRLVFVGRVSPMKNLTLTLAALARTTSPITFDIYGPAEDPAYWARCRQLISQLPSTVEVAYRGELHPDLVRETFAQYDAYAMPTLGENFGYTIVESLSASCPVLCSDRTPWTGVLAAGGGVVLTRLTEDELADQLERLARMSPAERLALRGSAADAYRTWAAGERGVHILDQMRLADRPGPAPRVGQRPYSSR